MKLELSAPVRRALRADAHHLEPVVMIGHDGLTPAVLHELDINLIAHGLIKIRVFSDDRGEREVMLAAMADALDAAPIQHLGKTLAIYRPVPADADDKHVPTAKYRPAGRDASRAAARPTDARRRPGGAGADDRDYRGAAKGGRSGSAGTAARGSTGRSTSRAATTRGASEHGSAGGRPTARTSTKRGASAHGAADVRTITRTSTTRGTSQGGTARHTPPRGTTAGRPVARGPRAPEREDSTSRGATAGRSTARRPRAPEIEPSTPRGSTRGARTPADDATTRSTTRRRKTT